MNNEDKKRMAALEWRVQGLEDAIRAMCSMQQQLNHAIASEINNSALWCNQCNCMVNDSFICSMSNCRNGLNPNDEEKVSDEEK